MQIFQGNHHIPNPDKCFERIENYDIFVDGGAITSKGESTIIELKDGKINVIREGHLSKEDMLKL